jgi:hypothetical protein
MGRLIDIKIDEALWERVKQAAEAAGITLIEYVEQSQGYASDVEQWEQQELAAYQKYPDQPQEVEVWLSEQACILRSQLLPIANSAKAPTCRTDNNAVLREDEGG